MIREMNVYVTHPRGAPRSSKTSFLSYVYSRLTPFRLPRENSGQLIAPFANDVVLLPTHSSSTYRTRTLKIGLRFRNVSISSIVIKYLRSMSIFIKCQRLLKCYTLCIILIFPDNIGKSFREFRVDFPFRKLR